MSFAYTKYFVWAYRNHPNRTQALECLLDGLTRIYTAIVNEPGMGDYMPTLRYFLLNFSWFVISLDAQNAPDTALEEYVRAIQAWKTLRYSVTFEYYFIYVRLHMVHVTDTLDFAEVHKHVRSFALNEHYAHLSYGEYLEHMDTLAPHLDQAVHTLQTHYCRRQIQRTCGTEIESTIPYNPTAYAHLLSIV
jgi:hypothetical protein